MSSKRIMIVDDSPTEQKIISKAISQPDILITIASDGEEAYQKAISEKPDLIILDVMMPVMDGFQTCRKIKSSPELKHIPIIMLTSKKEKSDEFWGKKQGADIYIRKPFKPQDLIDAISTKLS